jgi:haloalkane dehalogenase
MVSRWQQRKAYADVLGQRMAYVEEGHGKPIVLLHGNPTSSYIWRNIIPALSGLGRVIAPDLIGMGDSSKIGPEDPARYTFVRHRDFLDTFLKKLDATTGITFVLHDWGSALGFDWARRHPGAVRGIAYMEAITTPLASWEQWAEASRPLFQGFRSAAGERMVLLDNIFVEKVLPSGVLRALTTEEMTEYRRPYLKPGEDRLPTLVWPRQIPVGGDPRDVTQIVNEYRQWLAVTPGIPKLFINAEPGTIMRDPQRSFVRTWPDQTEITVPGRHFVQEDSGGIIGEAIATWMVKRSL